MRSEGEDVCVWDYFGVFFFDCVFNSIDGFEFV